MKVHYRGKDRSMEIVEKITDNVRICSTPNTMTGGTWYFTTWRYSRGWFSLGPETSIENARRRAENKVREFKGE